MQSNKFSQRVSFDDIASDKRHTTSITLRFAWQFSTYGSRKIIKHVLKHSVGTPCLASRLHFTHHLFDSFLNGMKFTSNIPRSRRFAIIESWFNYRSDEYHSCIRPWFILLIVNICWLGWLSRQFFFFFSFTSSLLLLFFFFVVFRVSWFAFCRWNPIRFCLIFLFWRAAVCWRWFVLGWLAPDSTDIPNTP